MTASDLVTALEPVAAAFEALGIAYFLGGSVASSAHGVARASLDADIVAEIEPAHVDRLAQQFAVAYYTPVEQMRTAAKEHRSFNLIHLATMFKIDVFVSRRRPFDRSAAARARPQAIGHEAERHVLIASAEDTVLAKLEWFRLGGGTSERQWWDIVGVLKVATDVDRVYLRRWAAALGVDDLLDQALAAARA